MWAERARAYWRRRETRERWTGMGVTTLMVAMMYAIAAWTDISTAGYAARVIQFAAVTAPPPVAPTVAAAPNTSAEPARTDAPDPPQRENITLQPQRLEIATQPLRPVAAQRPARATARARADRPAARAPEAAFTPGRPVTQSARPNGIRRPGGLSLSPTQRAGARATAQGASPLRAPQPRELEKRELATPPAVITERAQAVVDAGHLANTDMMAWVRDNQAELPPVVQRHMDYREGDWTAHVAHEWEGRTMDVFLMVKQGVDQMHILLVDGTQTFYFVDRGMLGQVSRLRVGRATRDPVITRIVSQETTISSPEALVFFEAFMSWWTQMESET